MSEIKEREKEGGGETTTDNYEDYDNDDDNVVSERNNLMEGQADHLNQVEIGIPTNLDAGASRSLQAI